MSDFLERAAHLPVTEFGYPGPLRERLNAAILAGLKTSTTSLLADYDHPGEELPRAGQHYRLIDSDERAIAIVETTEVRTARLAEVDLQHALDEGEGLTSVEEWREAHERFWTGAEHTASTGGRATLDDDTLVVLERFRVVELPSS
ncbi:ASCH domain-containing protein [Agromyces sp. NPDC057679]|uniref:ASCH domain-containing protein n=1 Tax=Agromyces sp. NPDC057679 TaxID=3346207 RepID=UPI003672A3FB